MQKNQQAFSSNLKMGVVCVSETAMNMYQITHRAFVRKLRFTYVIIEDTGNVGSNRFAIFARRFKNSEHHAYW
jgi:hypothetical protein